MGLASILLLEAARQPRSRARSAWVWCTGSRCAAVMDAVADEM
jgi:hypothetical protein